MKRRRGEKNKRKRESRESERMRKEKRGGTDVVIREISRAKHRKV